MKPFNFDSSDSEYLGEWLDSPESRADERALPSAEGALSAWMLLPRKRRSDPSDLAACALFDASFGLLATSQAKTSLAQFGADASIDDDDDKALAGFLSLGAAYPAPKELMDEHSNHSKTWEGSVLHFCAKRGALACMELFLDNGLAERDCSVAAPLLREPEPCTLRVIDSDFLKARTREAAIANGSDPDSADMIVESEDIQAVNGLLLALMGAHSAQSENLSISIASAEVRTGNPFFLALREGSRDIARHALAKAANNAKLIGLTPKFIAAGLFDAKLASHREALLQIAFEGSEPAADLALASGFSPKDASSPILSDFQASLCNAKGLGSFEPRLRALCQAWAIEPGFGQSLFDSASKECVGAIDAFSAPPLKEINPSRPGNAMRAFGRAANLCKSWSFEQRGFEAADSASVAALGSYVDQTLIEWESAAKGPASMELRALRELGSALGQSRLRSIPAARL